MPPLKLPAESWKNIYGNRVVPGPEPGSCRSVSHGKLTAGPRCGHAKIAGPFMGCGAAERAAADKRAVGAIKDHLR